MKKLNKKVCETSETMQKMAKCPHKIYLHVKIM